jgi:hypothetical protein
MKLHSPLLSDAIIPKIAFAFNFDFRCRTQSRSLTNTPPFQYGFASFPSFPLSYIKLINHGSLEEKNCVKQSRSSRFRASTTAKSQKDRVENTSTYDLHEINYFILS